MHYLFQICCVCCLLYKILETFRGTMCFLLFSIEKKIDNISGLGTVASMAYVTWNKNQNYTVKKSSLLSVCNAARAKAVGYNKFE